MSEWMETTLGALVRDRRASLLTGPFGTALKADEYKKHGTPLISVREIKDGRIVVDDNTPRLGRATLERLPRYLLHEGDIVFGRKGAIERSAQISKSQEGFFLGSDGICLRFNGDIHAAFVAYQIRSRRMAAWLMANAGGTTMPSMNQAVLDRLPLVLPPLPVQRRIAAGLSVLDDKIDLNNRIRANLEAQAQALFHSWFVDCEPWGGTMPEGWRIVSVGDLHPILETGKRPKGGAVASGIPSIGAENVKRLGVFDYSSAKFIPVDFAQTMIRGRIHGYELLLYKDGGKPGTFMPHFSMFGEGFPYEDCFINEHVFKLDFRNRGYNIFSYFMFQTDEIFQWLETSGMKAAIPGINQNNVLEIKIPHPDNPRVAEFGAIVEPFFKRIFRGCRENRTLAAIRDTLLPKLMSGEIDVSRVEIPA